MDKEKELKNSLEEIAAGIIKEHESGDVNRLFKEAAAKRKIEHEEDEPIDFESGIVENHLSQE